MSAAVESVIRVGIDATGAKAGAGEVVTSLRAIRAEAEKTGRAIGQVGMPGSSSYDAANRNPARRAGGSGSESARAARAAADLAREEATRARALEVALTRRQGLEQRISRQLGENADLTSRLDQATAAYAAQIRNLAPGTTAWIRAQGDFRRETQAVSGEIARQGGLLKTLNSNADRTIGAIGRTSKLSRFEVTNLGYQLNDIAVSLASGQSPFLVLAQQGSQISQIFSGKGLGAGGILREFGLILGRLITPITGFAAVLGLGALAIGDFVGRAADITATAKLLGLTTDQVQVLGRTLQTVGKESWGEFRDQAREFAGRAADAVRNPKQQFARLFEANGRGLADANGKLRDQVALWRDAVGLIRGAGNEVDAIEIGRILGLTEDFTRAAFSSAQGFDEVRRQIEATGTILGESELADAAGFEREWSAAWRGIGTVAADVIGRMEAGLFRLLSGLPETFRGIGDWARANGIPTFEGLTGALVGGAPPGTKMNAIGFPEPNPDQTSFFDWVSGVGRDAARWAGANNRIGDAAVIPDRPTFSGPTPVPSVAPAPTSDPDAALNALAAQLAPSGGVVPTRAGGPAKPTVIPADNPSTNDATGDRYRDQVRDLEAAIRAQDALNAAYNQGAAAVATARREQEVANENSKIATKFTEDQRTAVERLNAVYLDAKRTGAALERIQSLKDSNELAAKELELVDATKNVRERELAILRAKQDLQSRGIDPGSDIGQRTIEEVTKGVELGQTIERQGKIADDISSMWTSAFDKVGSAITDAFTKGEGAAIDFGSVVDGVVSEIIQAFVKLAVLAPIKNFLFGTSDTTVFDMNGLVGSLVGNTQASTGTGAAAGGGGWGSLISGAFDLIGSLFHTGGVAGFGTSGRVVSMDAYRNATRYHGGGIAGFAPDEVPAILQREEEVITRNDPRHRWNQQTAADGRPTSVTNNYHVVNRTGQDVEVTEQGRQKNGSGGDDITVVIDTVMAKKLRKRGSRMNQAMRQDYGAQQKLRGR